MFVRFLLLLDAFGKNGILLFLQLAISTSKDSCFKKTFEIKALRNKKFTNLPYEVL
jgi:hypothetical protein